MTDLPTSFSAPTPPQLVVVGASAGGVQALTALAASLPPEFPVPVCIVLHMASDTPSTLAGILTRAGTLPATQVQHRVALRPGTLFVARPDRHLVVGAGEARSEMGPRENRHRPSVDVLFRTAAAAYGPRVIGVVLTGSGDDGAAGLRAIRRSGGWGVIQDPEQAFSSGMPLRALEIGADYCVSLGEMARLLTHLVTGSPEGAALAEAARVTGAERWEQMEITQYDAERMGAAGEVAALNRGPDAAPLSGFTCPECGGRIWEMEEEGLLRFRCRVGHAYSDSTFLGVHTDALEGALWAALNSLEESAALCQRMAERARERNHGLTARRLQEKAEDTEQQAAMIRTVLERNRTTAPIPWDEDEGTLPPDAAPQHVNTVGDRGTA